jgi:hypothetical protein
LFWWLGVKCAVSFGAHEGDGRIESRFAQLFLDHVERGETIGEALRNAKIDLGGMKLYKLAVQQGEVYGYSHTGDLDLMLKL